jgi:hypothetical protein
MDSFIHEKEPIPQLFDWGIPSSNQESGLN